MAVKKPEQNQSVRIQDILELYKNRLEKVEGEAMFANALVLKLNRKVTKLKELVPEDALKGFDEKFEKEDANQQY